MTESLRDHRATALRRNLPFLIITSGVVIILLLVYVGGYIILPGTIQSAYQANNCETVLSRADAYARLYPFAASQQDLFETVQECAVYTLALMNENESAGRDAYHAFTVYSESYPNGRFADDVHERTASVLMRLAREEITEKEYAGALQNIDLVLSDFSGTPAAEEAESLMFDLYMGWGADLRNAGNFAEAEAIFVEVRENATPENAKSSQLELAQTYLAWGLALQSQEEFAEAQLKYDTAILTDPDPSSRSGPAAQARSDQVELYNQWGDYLIRQKDFANALGRYEAAANLFGSDNETAAKDLIVKGYVQWAAGIGAEEDFLGALVLLEVAQEIAVSDSTKELVDDTSSNLYSTFSKSSGEQSRNAMVNAVAIMCKHHIQPDLPIFRLDKENIRVGVYGAEDQLPESITAMTPASLHYVACIEEDNRVVATSRLPVSTMVFGGGPGVVQIQYRSFQYVWSVVLREIDTGIEVAATIIEGADPPALILDNITFTTYNYFGPKPDIAQLVDWIRTVIEK